MEPAPGGPLVMPVPQVAQRWESLLEGDVRAAIEREALPAFLRRQRWYAGKARVLESLRLIDAAHPEGFPPATFLALAELRYRDHPPETYFLPLGLAHGPEVERLVREAAGRIIHRWDGSPAGGVL